MTLSFLDIISNGITCNGGSYCETHEEVGVVHPVQHQVRLLNKKSLKFWSLTINYDHEVEYEMFIYRIILTCLCSAASAHLASQYTTSKLSIVSTWLKFTYFFLSNLV
jgi:hypothetical protein